MKKTLIVLILISLFASLAINPQQVKANDNSVNTIVAMKNAYDSALSLNENNKVDSSYKHLTNDTSSYYLNFADTIYQQIHEDNIVKLSNESNAYNDAEVVYEIQGDTLHINGSGPIDDFSGSNKAPWYEYRDTITNIVIDEGVTSIGDQAFISFTNLDYLVLPNTITSIGEGAFYECSNLKTVILPNSLTTILEGTFCDCSCLRYIIIPSSVNYIGEEALLDCDPNLIVYIHDNDYAKQYCIDNDLSYVEVDSYFVLDKISITAPSKLNYEYNEELDLTGLEVYEVYSNGNYSIPIRINDGYTVSDYNKQQAGQQKITVTYKTFNACFNVNVYRGNIIQSGTCGDQINFYLYEGGILRIEGNGPMDNYTLLTNPNKAPWYEYRDSIYYVEVAYGVTSIGTWAFKDCSSLSTIIIPNSVTSLVGAVFAGCSSLTSITIPDSVTSIGSGAFRECSSLTSITIPDSVTSIGDYAFDECSSLTSITIPDSVISIGDSAFDECTSLTSITIPDSVTSIGSGAFSRCTSLTSITIPDSVTSIGNSAFYNCTSLTSITIPDSVTSIGDLTFSCCTSLTSITIPDSVTSIGDYAFEGCSSLTSLTMPISASIASYSFTGVSNLKEVRLTKGTGKGVNYTNSRYQNTPWYKSRNNLTSLVLDDGITSIGDYTFDGCTSLTSINIPDSVTSIGGYTFSSCSSLTSITIPSSAKTIGNYVFSGCSSLTSITIPDSVTSIGSAAFNRCTSLTSITIPDSVTSIGDYAFNECSSLTSITIPDSVTSIGSVAFYNCSSLTSITIPDSVTSIGDYTFRGCSSLTSITIPDSVTSIGSVAFNRCTSLTSITIPDSVTSIGSDSFYGCSNNLKIYGYDNDYLKQYCEDNNLTYVALYKISNKTVNGTLLQNGTIRLNLSVDIDEDVSLDNAYALINGNKAKLERNDQGKVIIHTSGLAPKNINDDITIRYYDENDNPISSNIELNVRDYIETLLSGYLNKKTRAFYKSLLNYGAYAQELFEYNTDNLANSTLEDIDKDLSDVTYDKVSTHAPNIVGSTEGISAYGQALVLKDEVDFRVYFLLDGSHSIDEYTFTDGETKLNPIKQSNNIFYVTISKNAAPDLDKNHTISVNLNNAGDLKVSTSVLAYCEMTLRKDPVSQEDIKLANFVKAIYKYSLAAKNLLGE